MAYTRLSLCWLLFVLIWSPNTTRASMVAQAIMMTNSQYGISRRLGTVLFTQTEYDGPVRISGQLTFMEVDGTRVGMHVHSYGNLTRGCDSTGPHFNPDGHQHGGLSDQDGHVGDLGNVKVENGRCMVDITDGRIRLTGPNSILGRALVVHMNRDDLGKGDNEESLISGNVGRAQACGIIGIASQHILSPPPAASATKLTSSSSQSTSPPATRLFVLFAAVYLFGWSSRC